MLGLVWLLGAPPAASAACDGAASAQVVVNELRPDATGSEGTGGADDELVELYNAGTTTVDLSGWKLLRQTASGSSASTLVTLPDATSLASQAHLLVAGTGVGGALVTVTGLDLGSGLRGDLLLLEDCDGVRADGVIYGGANTDGLTEDDASVPAEGAPRPGEAVCLARRVDGLDTGSSRADFVLAPSCTPGLPNPDLTCKDTAGGVLITELLPNPAGDDVVAGTEFVELLNLSGQAIDLRGWSLLNRTSVGVNGPNERTVITFAPGVAMADGARLLVGGPNVGGADVVVPGLDLGSGSGVDLLALLDCEGTRADGVLYGSTNNDQLDEDDGFVPAAGPGSVGDDACVVRQPDDVDTDRSGDDFVVLGTCTPGLANPGDDPPPSCDQPATTVRLNEALPNPAGADGDAGTEFVEIVNTGTEEVELGGWQIVARTSPKQGGGFHESVRFTFPTGATLAAGALGVVGDSMVSGATWMAPGLGLPNGSGGDLLLLLDCKGTRVDGLLYGPTNDDALDEDDGHVPTAGLGSVGDDQCVQRVLDGVDTDRALTDLLMGTCTPGQPNEAPPAPTCEPAGVEVKLNEVLPNPAGADGDAGTEFVELFNPGATEADVGGWSIVARTSPKQGGGFNESVLAELPQGTTVAAGGFLVVGDSAVAGAQVVVPGLGVPNGSGGDLLLLLDCDGVRADALLYGPTNDDGLDEDDGAVPVAGLGSIGDDVCVLRAVDGVDTDRARDDLVLGTCTPGATNLQPEQPTCPRAEGVVVINEFRPNPAGADAEVKREFVELYNPGEAPVDLSLWSLAKQTSGSVTELMVFTSGTALAAGGYLVVGGENVPEADVVADFDLGSGSGGDVVMLRDPVGVPVDVVLYGSSNDDALQDDDCTVPDLGAGGPGEDDCIARRADGLDSDASAADLVVTDVCTPGSPNTDLRCKDPGAKVTINEFLPDPAGTDSVAGTEFVEIHNPANVSVDVGGWQIVKVGKLGDAGTVVVTLDAGSKVGAGGFFVVGGLFAEEADQYVERFDLLSGSGGDQVILRDCEGARIDSVLYGGDNDDDLTEDDGHLPERGADEPQDDACLGRRPDGADTNRSAADVARLPCTPGGTNTPGADDTGKPGAEVPTPGCGCGPSGPQEAGPVQARPGDGCATAPSRGLPLGFALLLVGLRRRPRRTPDAAAGAPR